MAFKTHSVTPPKQKVLLPDALVKPQRQNPPACSWGHRKETIIYHPHCSHVLAWDLGPDRNRELLHGSLVKTGLRISCLLWWPQVLSWVGGQGGLLIHTCRFSGDLNIVITGFPVLDTELPQAPLLSPAPALWSRLVCIFCRIASPHPQWLWGELTHHLHMVLLPRGIPPLQLHCPEIKHIKYKPTV